MTEQWQVHKFGGTSVGNTQRIKGVAQIICEFDKKLRPAVVVSAIKGVTDKLIGVTKKSKNRDDSYASDLSAIRALHITTAKELLEPYSQNAVITSFESDFKDLQDILRGLRLSGISDAKNEELISGFGEVWSAQLLSAHLNDLGYSFVYLDARKVLYVEPHEASVTIDWPRSEKALEQWLSQNTNSSTKGLIVTGFVATTKEGVATTLKRNGSDYSGSIFGALLQAPEITIWTDVDGVFSADPRLVPEAVVLEDLSYDEASELAYFGAKVVHPSTMAPALKKGIPIWIKNTFNPKFPGTKIHKTSKSTLAVKGLSLIEDVAMINIEGNGMVGIPGVAERLFSAMSRANVSVILISQAGSEYSICFAVPQSQSMLAKQAAEQVFFSELHQGLIEKVDMTEGCSILAVVGDNMADRPGLASKFFKALGQSQINVKAIAQGSSERNISAIISKSDSTRALRSVHSSFYLSDQTLSLGIIGCGVVGSNFLDQLAERVSQLKEKRQIDVRIRAITSSKQMLLAPKTADLKNWRTQLKDNGVEANMDELLRHLKSGEYPHNVLIDMTASEQTSQKYSQWLSEGFHVITANKKGNTSSMEYYNELRKSSHANQKHFLYSTNVGAGLPIVQTLRDLHHTGDRVICIEGVFSGTLSYIFNQFSTDKLFSSVVKEAQSLGYTEPDPRDDLSGMDVARKLVILAREIGLNIELKDVVVESLVPENLRSGSIAEFLNGLPKADSHFQKRLQESTNHGQVLRYVGTLDANGKATVSLKAFSKEHAFARLNGSDNIVSFQTDRYNKNPLVIQGPGAGPQVTAAGVFSDLLRLAAYVGAKL